MSEENKIKAPRGNKPLEAMVQAFSELKLSWLSPGNLAFKVFLKKQMIMKAGQADFWVR